MSVQKLRLQYAATISLVFGLLLLGPFLLQQYRWLTQEVARAETLSILREVSGDLAQGHLWFEESVAGDPRETVEKWQEKFDHAEQGVVEYRESLGSHDQEVLDRDVQVHTGETMSHSQAIDFLASEIKDLRRLAEQRAASASLAGSRLDLDFDELNERADDLIVVLADDLISLSSARSQERLGIFRISQFIWISCVAGFVVLLLMIDRRRRRTEQEQEQLRDRFQQAQKLESLGVLAGGIAHDFNNLLTGIGGRLSLASSYAGAVGELPRLLGEAEEAVGQASRLTDQLLTFAKGGQPVTERVDLEELVRRVATFASAGSATRLRWDIDKDLWAAHVDPGQIGQVVQNLVINARQAMDGHGQIHVVLRNLVIGPYDDASLQAGRYVELRVTDDGPGIPAGILERIFEPYFSTKESSGLGLATTHSIVTNHGGTIKVDSLPTSGTTFTIRLPASDKAEDGQTLAPEDEPAAVNARTATGDALLRVLVMDDNPSLLRLVEEMLVAMGHEAHGVEHGEKALQDFHEALDSGQPFDAAILDLTIEGGIGGMKTGEELLEVVPDLPIFLMSGYSEEGIPEPEAMGFKGFLPKPFNVGDLRRMLETVKS